MAWLVERVAQSTKRHRARPGHYLGVRTLHFGNAETLGPWGARRRLRRSTRRPGRKRRGRRLAVRTLESRQRRPMWPCSACKLRVVWRTCIVSKPWTCRLSHPREEAAISFADQDALYQSLLLRLCQQPGRPLGRAEGGDQDTEAILERSAAV